MDSVNTEKYWIGDRCYTKNPTSGESLLSQVGGGDAEESSNGAEGGTNQSVVKPYVEEDKYSCDPDAPNESEDANKYIIEETENGFKTNCEDIPSQFYAVIIGVRGQTKSRIERETETKIIVPRQGEIGIIAIRGLKKANVINCRRRVEDLTSQARFKMPNTHFTCFPLNSPTVLKNMQEFKDTVLEECGDSSRGIDEDLFVQLEKVHLTICMVTLLDEKERNLAADILKNSKNEIKEKFGHEGKITVQIKGLEIMNDDPTQVDVLFAKCNAEDDKLQKIANLVNANFTEAGLGRNKKGDHVKFHCSILNSRKKAERLAEREGGSKENWHGKRFGPGSLKRETFDASLILAKFKDYDFGTIDITEIKLATLNTADADGFYKAFCSVPL